MLLGISSGFKQNHCRKLSFYSYLLRVFKWLFKISEIGIKHYQFLKHLAQSSWNIISDEIV